MAKIGDTVRFLNDVGGGVIVRIDGRTAYVRDPHDGFETPMPLTECIIVPSAKVDATAFDAPEPKPQPMPSIRKADNSLTATLLFEPHDIKRLSQTPFDLYLVNDSNYRLLYSVAARDKDASDFTVVAHGEAEPNTQIFLAEIEQVDLNNYGVIAVQFVAVDAERPFQLKPPVNSLIRMDLSRLAKLHCFTPTDYSAVPVLTLPIIRHDSLPEVLKIESLRAEAPKDSSKPQQKPALSKPKQNLNDPTVVDLHINQLLDSTAGLQPADMLECQLREFDRRMAEAAKRPGSKIIFIHGKGEGVLRHAIIDRLRRRWPRCEVQDASFREYGFGATQVTVRK